MKILLREIGYVKNNIIERHNMPIASVKSEIRILPEYRKALKDISKCKYLWVLCFFHKAARNVLQVRRRKVMEDDNLHGVFVIHSPDRPNPISLTRVKLIKRKGLALFVKKLDAISGTPVIDIKSADKYFHR